MKIVSDLTIDQPETQPEAQPEPRVSPLKGRTALTEPDTTLEVRQLSKAAQAVKKRALLRRHIEQKRAVRAIAIAKGRTILFNTPAGMERLSRLLIGCLSPALTQQDLCRKAGINSSTLSALSTNFRNRIEDVVIHAIEMETVVNLAPHLPDGSSRGINPWFLVLVACGFLDERNTDKDFGDLEKGLKRLKQMRAQMSPDEAK